MPVANDCRDVRFQLLRFDGRVVALVRDTAPIQQELVEVPGEIADPDRVPVQVRRVADGRLHGWTGILQKVNETVLSWTLAPPGSLFLNRMMASEAVRVKSTEV